MVQPYKKVWLPMTRYTVTLEDQSRPEDVEAVHTALRLFNEKHASSPNYQPLNIMVRDGDGTIIGGLLGGTYWQWLHVDIFWLDERLRGQGLGQRILAQAEAEAQARGCIAIHLDTTSFQALPFYKKYGYVVFGIQEDCPPGHTRYYLRKRLTPGDASPPDISA